MPMLTTQRILNKFIEIKFSVDIWFGRDAVSLFQPLTTSKNIDKIKQYVLKTFCEHNYNYASLCLQMMIVLFI